MKQRVNLLEQKVDEKLAGGCGCSDVQNTKTWLNINCNQKCSMYREFALHFYGTSAPRRSVHVRSQRYVLHDTTGRTDASWDTLRTWRTDPKMHLERALSLEDTSICVQ